MDEKTQLQNWDCPESVDFVAMANMIEYVRSNNGQLPPDFNSNEERNLHDGSSLLDTETAKQLQDILGHLADKDSIRFVIVDGFMLYWDKLVYDQLDCKISCMASYESLKQRRSAREGYSTVDGYWVDPPGYFDAIVWPEYMRLNKHTFDEKNRSVSEHETINGVFNVNTDELPISETALRVAAKIKEGFPN
jgi:nicotinamide/nicotinate riboside kinase